MRIIICDSEQLVVEKISHLIHDYYSSNNLEKPPEIVCYNNGEDLLSDTHTKDIVFIDIKTPELNDIYVVNTIKEFSPFTIIIATTAFSEYLDDAMRYNVFRYLSKPLDETCLIKYFKNALKHYQAISHNVLVNIRNKSYTLPTHTIIMIEAKQKKVYIHTECNIIETTDTIQYWSRQLPTISFFQTHRSFIVNFLHVKSFDKSLVYLNNDYKAYLARRKYSEFKKNFLLYLKHT